MQFTKGVVVFVYLCVVCSEASSDLDLDLDYIDDQFMWPEFIEYTSNNTVVAGIDDKRPASDKYCPKPKPEPGIKFSSPIECARTCNEGEQPKTCYYRFVVEVYPVAGRACNICQPTKDDMHCSSCQCVQADGVERVAIVVNRMLPGPSIEVCRGDRVIIDVENHMKGADVTIHWHGILQEGSQYYDGVPYVTQCPIPEGASFRYQWTAHDVGTHFWHAHSGLQKMDGVYGPLIVRKPQKDDVHGRLYEFDLSRHVVLISDWMHEMSVEKFPGRNRRYPGQNPDSLLINGRGQYTDSTTGNTTNSTVEVFEVQPNSRYRFRLINSFCSVCPSQLTVQGHTLTLIAADGLPVQPTKINSIISFAGERYDFILNTKNTIGTYWMQLRGMGPCAEHRVQQLAILKYKGAPEEPNLKSPDYENGLDVGVILNPLDAVCHVPRQDAVCVSNLKSAIPIDKSILKEEPDVKIYLPIKFHVYQPEQLFVPNTYKRFMVTEVGAHLTSVVDGISFKFPSSPVLSQLDDVPPERFCNYSSMPKDCRGDCTCTHNINIPRHAVVEVVVVDEFQARGISHPFHFHGYAPYVIGMGRSPDDRVKRITLKHAMEWDRMNLMQRCFDLPPAKDTFPLPNNGYIIFRFRADNPGFWLFHCHFIYHQAIGMDMLLHVGEQNDLPPVPQNFPKCGNYIPPVGPFTKKPTRK